MLLATLPFLAAAVLYWITIADLFTSGGADLPGNWSVRISLPVLTGSLSSLAAAASRDDVSYLLLSAAGAGVLFSIVITAVLRQERQYFDLRLGVPLGKVRLRLSGWKVLRLIGLCVLTYACVATLLVSSR